MMTYFPVDVTIVFSASLTPVLNLTLAAKNVSISPSRCEGDWILHICDMFGLEL